MEKINTKNAPEAIGPYTQAIKVGNTLYSSGQIGLIPETMQLISGGIENQTKQVCKNLGAVLKESGMDFDNVIKTTIYLDNLINFSIVNKIYGEFFINKPARSTVEVSKLPLGAMVEIELIAQKN